MSVISTDVVVRAFEKAVEKYETESAQLRAAIVNIAADCEGCLREYTPATLAHALCDSVGEFDADAISTAVTEAKNVIRNASFHRLFREHFSVLPPYSNTETGKIIEAIEKGVSEYDLQTGKKKKKTFKIRDKIMGTTKCDVASVDSFVTELRAAIEKHVKLRGSREEREKLDLSEYTCF